MATKHDNALRIALVALALCVVQWIWLAWRHQQDRMDLEQEVRHLRGEIAALQERRLPSSAPRTDELDYRRLSRALERLGDRNVLVRYQAGLTVQEYGSRAVSELVELVRSGNSRARNAALIILGDLQPPEAAEEIREMVATHLGVDGGGPASPEPRQKPMSGKTVAALLGLLAKMKDEAALPLFRRGLEHEEEPVRTASMAGVRRLGAIDFLPQLIAHLGKERSLVNKELEKAILSLCRRAPDDFIDRMQTAPAAGRFAVVRLLSKDMSAAALRTLRAVTRDADPRVALGAARVLALRGDDTGRELATRLATDGSGAELQQVAVEVLRQLGVE